MRCWRWRSADGLAHFTVDSRRLDAAADYVAAVTRAELSGPGDPVSRALAAFRGRRDRSMGCAAENAAWRRRDEMARARIDLCVVSVLLDAGAGPAWTFRELDTGRVRARSEGLAVASLHAFRVWFVLR